MADVFLSYSRDDQATARRFADAFERAGLSVWWDVTLNPGEAYDRVTEKALREASAVVVLWSKKSVDSRWVRAEATSGDRNGTLVPVMIEPCLRPVMFELTQTADLSHWTGDSNDKAWQSYLAAVRRFVAKGAPAPESPAASRRSSTPPSVEHPSSIAVPPFASMSGDEQQGGSASVASVQSLPPQNRRRKFVIAGAVLVLAAVVSGVWVLRRAPEAPPEVARFVVVPSNNAPLQLGGTTVKISPDGKRIVYVGQKPDGGTALYVRELSALEPRMIAGTDIVGTYQVSNPFLTDAGASVVFRSPGKGIIKVALNGGPPTKVIDENPRFLGGGAAPDNTLVLGLGDGIYRVPDSGGTAERLTPPEAPNVLFAGPKLIPGTRLVLFHKVTVPEIVSQIVLLDLDTRAQQVLVDDGIEASYLPSGHIVFGRGTTLMAMPFDLDRRRVTGPPVAVVEGVLRRAAILPPQFAVSTGGTLIYIPEPSSTSAEAVTPVWVDRSGKETGPVVSTPIDSLTSLQLSPDGRRLLVGVEKGILDSAIWVYDLTGRPPVPLIEKGNNTGPLWFPDGTRVAFASNRSGLNSFYSLPADASLLEPQVLETGLAPIASGIPVFSPDTWLKDGRLVFTMIRGEQNSLDILVAAPKGGAAPEGLLNTEFNEGRGRVSPDGRWIAFQWNRTGRPEIWVRLISGGAPVRVSQNGGSAPLWSHSGQELFFREGSKVMSAAFHEGADPSFDQPVLLFDRPFESATGSYDVASDGRFVMIPRSSEPPAAPNSIVVVQNWMEELRRLVPVN